MLASLLVAVTAGPLGIGLGSPCDSESAYFCARVEGDPARPSARALVLDTITQSRVDLEDPTYLGARYAEELAAVVDAFRPAGQPIEALHVGGGGFTMPRYIRATRPGSRGAVLELDPNVVRLARRRLGLVLDADLSVLTGDARVSIRALPPGRRFDLVIGDAFGGLTVPWHLTTVEFLDEVRARLRPGGVYALNIIDLPPLGFARAEAATLLASFRHVAVLAPRGYLAGGAGGNFVFAASDRPLPLDAMRAQRARRGVRAGREPTVVADRAAVAAFAGGARPLRDDFAPVDQLLTPRARASGPR